MGRGCAPRPAASCSHSRVPESGTWLGRGRGPEVRAAGGRSASAHPPQPGPGPCPAAPFPAPSGRSGPPRVGRRARGASRLSGRAGPAGGARRGVPCGSLSPPVTGPSQRAVKPRNGSALQWRASPALSRLRRHARQGLPALPPGLPGSAAGAFRLGRLSLPARSPGPPGSDAGTSRSMVRNHDCARRWQGGEALWSGLPHQPRKRTV